MADLSVEWLERLLAGRDLTEVEASELLQTLASGEVPDARAGALLAALRAKGETAAEIRGFAQTLRKLAERPQLTDTETAVDIVGTGGDGSGSLNLSTGSALVAAAAGARVIKHGNRSISSRSGSADVLESIGLPMPLDAVAAARCLDKSGFTFLFAPHYHPAMKAIGPARGQLGIRTAFNILGPLVNPAEPGFHLLGAFSSAMARLMAETLAGMRITRAFVIHGEPGWDEATPVGPFELYEVTPGNVRPTTRDPLDAGIERCTAEDLAGGDAEENAARLTAVLTNAESGPHRDALTLGAGLALELVGLAPDLRAGIAAANAAIDDGRGARLLEQLRTI